MLTGLYFGSFNPIHNGHLMLANYLVEYGGIGELWFVISPQNPFKEKKSLLPDYQRLELVRRAVEDYMKFRACDVEFSLPKPSYTIDTLTYLKEKYPNKEFCLIIGSDNIERFPRWKNAQQIIDNYHILVFPRKDCPVGDFANLTNVHIVDAPLIEVSSTFIRESIADGKDVRFYMPQKVWEYVDEMNFYKK
ncbi:MAG: nicotinate-nucleotide adenylyltransferase [Bacteroidales bacterium]|nr:nicotinate-nucleotide adenylyltransferase [Bacteroidales bacterium]MBR6178038.1 nicotinate-nucleotide adenylyltransferase [Bacteroidales bacterium]